jgi:hypothetical protein
MAWLCTHKQTNHSGSIGNGRMCIVTGPNIDIATKLIKRLKGMFNTKLGLTFNDKETHLQVNGCIGYKAASLKSTKKALKR